VELAESSAAEMKGGWCSRSDARGAPNSRTERHQLIAEERPGVPRTRPRPPFGILPAEGGRRSYLVRALSLERQVDEHRSVI
jgi:hypothetical protein